MALLRLSTAEDLEAMPHDGHRYEFVRGELLRMPPAGRLQGRFTAKRRSRDAATGR